MALLLAPAKTPPLPAPAPPELGAAPAEAPVEAEADVEADALLAPLQLHAARASAVAFATAGLIS